MGFRNVVLVMALLVCLAVTAFAEIPLGPKNIVTQKFPTDNMSGSEIMQEVQEGAPHTSDQDVLSFRNESIFITSKSTGMSPNAVTKGVRAPVIVAPIAPIAGTWSLKLTDVNTKNMMLTLSQSEDAIFGFGDLTMGGTTTQVNVGGTIIGNKIAMFVIPAGTSTLFRLSLTWTPGLMNGNYIYSAPGITQPGIVFGNAISPNTVQSPQAQQTQQGATQQGASQYSQ